MFFIWNVPFTPWRLRFTYNHVHYTIMCKYYLQLGALLYQYKNTLRKVKFTFSWVSNNICRKSTWWLVFIIRETFFQQIF